MATNPEVVCPATAEAILEREEDGEFGCPLCGRSWEVHEHEPDPNEGLYLQPGDIDAGTRDTGETH